MLQYHLKILASNLIWGSLPLYFFFIGEYSPLFLLTVQISSAFATLFFLTYFFTSIRIKLRDLILSLLPAMMLSINWGGYAFAVKSGYVIEASYAYLILPILLLSINLVLGKDRQFSTKLCVTLTLIILVIECFISGVFPLIGLGISLSFLGYALWHTKYQLNPIKSLLHETLLMLPVSIVICFIYDDSIYNDKGLIALGIESLSALFLLGILTVTPLALFVSGAKRVNFKILPLYQFISPVLGMLLGIYLYHEPLDSWRIAAYAALILILVVYNLYHLNRREEALI
ncbi:hypothetical protein OA92_00160 [Marinomonas sp. SBI22]|uniref:EamA family transporter n=1 Tax=unclassified Marinomonas TaxID=196814 RepID=UPI0007AF198F|nr:MULTISPECIES: hypothetical protein [unclassified Marinomonas]KZM45670.1 hypothetical protein OA92_00160 [Marinomonas sp. SBI22]KZM46189.1 hypothetical protein OA91_04305 [Marinomonas sp. SBI8L]